MVSKTEESKLQELETQVENGGGGAWEYLSLVRKLKLRRSDKVLKHGLTILNDPKKRSNLGPDEKKKLTFFFFHDPTLNVHLQNADTLRKA
nr:ER membrane protein complex subunit 2-like [Tanacetum cinerariifolium]